MVTIKELMNIEEALLRLDTECRYLYSFDELIKSEQYMKEIGAYTSLYFTVQTEYSKVLNNESKDYLKRLTEYNNRLLTDPIDIDIDKYVNFIKSILHYITTEEYKSHIEKLIANEN